MFGLDVSGGVVPEDVAFHIDQIAAERDVIRPQFDALTDGFNGAASGVELRETVAQHGHIGGVRGGGKTFRQGQKRAACAILCNAVHKGGIHCFQRGFSVQFFQRHVRHAVREEDDRLPRQVHRVHGMILSVTVLCSSKICLNIAPE